MKSKRISLKKAMKSIAVLKKRPWWETVQPPADLDLEESQIFVQLLINMCRTSLQLLRRALCTNPEWKPLFTMNNYGRLLGMFEMNNWALASRNPLRNYFKHVESALPDAERKEAIDALGADNWPLLDHASRRFAEGTGLFLLGACINHSCMPNVSLSKPEGAMDDSVVVVARRFINKNEQFFISYVDNKQDFRARREMLAYYGFECDCPKCMKDELHFKMTRPKVVLYYSSVSGSRQVRKDQSDIEHLFEAHKVDYTKIDVSLDEHQADRLAMAKASGLRDLPQVHVNGQYRGGAAELRQANEMAAGFTRFLHYGAMRKLSYYNPQFFATYSS
eukprot:TRINITY_DN66966_c9_g1_i1.p1 TRINITY_DN66966_c9_g1~~TRINITY_DN66966_c9_g1_i1.p1  ORF type:complete len:334 (+),score=179.70 TRINITY_DN66966_c9_g1_i1:147-1148(+)